MSCLPGMPCYSSTTTYSYYPPGCENQMVFRGYPITSTLICYAGPILPNSGIAPGDSLTVALQKLDNELSPTQLVTNLIAALETNPTLLNLFCNVISNCNTTTSTTTRPVTTSTTTDRKSVV